VVVIGESDLNDPRLIRSLDEHGYGLDGQWADDFHHAVHAALTNETVGYYADFGDVEMIAAALREPFVYDGRYSAHRNRRHGASSAGLPRERFVVSIQNHDQVGNRATGDRLSSVLAPDQLRLVAALLLLSPYVPLIFMGQEHGETNPFQYFVSHGDPSLVDAVRTGRRREFESFGWGDDVPDPQAEETFLRSMVDREKTAHPTHAQMLALYHDLLALREEELLLKPDGADVSVSRHGDVIALLRTARRGDGERHALVATFNCSAETCEVTLPELASGGGGQWTLRLSTDDREYGGSDRVPRELGAEQLAVASGSWSVASTPGSESPARERPTPASGGGTHAQPIVSLPPWTAALYGQTS
jgi:maltooligosyltrehalose trehalohydrolase